MKHLTQISCTAFAQALASTLMSLMPGECLELEVASTNLRAIHLYEKLGFVKTAELTRWYRVV